MKRTTAAQPSTPQPIHQSWVRPVLWIALALAIVYASLGVRTFYGQYYLTIARRDSPTPEMFEQNLRRSEQHDPKGGRANIELARLLDKPGSYGAALDHLRRGMLTYRDIRTYLQLGRLLHRIGGRAAEAREALEASVRMNPGNIRAMEQLALIAISDGASTEVERWTDAIRNRDFTNLNAIYIRARDAERLGNITGARTLYQQISAAIHNTENLPVGTLFNKDEIRRRLSTTTPSETQQP